MTQSIGGTTTVSGAVNAYKKADGTYVIVIEGVEFALGQAL